MKKLLLTLAAMGLGSLSTQALAEAHEVKMLNKGADGMMVFEPAYLQVAPGDTVTFVPTDASHNSVLHAGPADAEGWSGAMNEPVTVTLDSAGVYVYKCVPHVPLGMVGVIQVGDNASADAARAASADLQSSIAVNGERLGRYLDQVN